MIDKICSIAYSPNGKKLAVATFQDQTIYFFDETFEKKDKITARGADKDNKNFIIKGIEFSPDGSMIAVAQTDNLIQVYKIGIQFGEKKSICSKI